MVKAACVAMLLLVAPAVLAQNNINGIPAPPGPQTRSNGTQNCADPAMGAVPAAGDTACADFAPGFAVPSANTPRQDTQPVTAVIRVNAVVEKPAAFPYPVDFNVVGSATMLRARLPRLQACLAVGRGWSRRANTATSTTCVDRKGEIVAYQECQPVGGGAPASCTVGTPGMPAETVAAGGKP